jgi:HK97 family phage portal protein
VNLIESMFRGGLGLRADASGAPAPWDDYWYQPVGRASSSGMRVTPDTAKQIPTVIACVSARAKMLAMLPCKIFTDLANGGSKPVPNHPLYTVLYSRPNEIQTAFDFKFMMQAHVDLRGNAYALKIAGPRGPVDQLRPLHPDRVKVEILRESGRLIYVYDDPLTNKTERYTQDEIFHLRDWSDNAAVGQSRIAMGIDAFGLALARQDYQARFLKNDARSPLVMTGLNFKTKEDEQAYIKSLQDGNTAKNRGKAMILPPGADIKNIGVTPVDQQLLEGAKYSDVQICSIMGVLPHVVGIDAGKAATFASTEQFNIMNAQFTVHPMAVMWEQAIQRDLIVSDRYYARFSMAALLRGDNATRFAGYAVAIQNSWMCPDDARALEDLNPIPNGEGKVFWRSANLLPLSQLEAPSQMARGSASDVDDDDAGEDGAGGDAETDASPKGAAGFHAYDPAMQGRLKLLAMATAERCVRKEVSAVRRLIAADAGVYQVTEFYAEHARFVADVFRMSSGTALMAKIQLDARAQSLSALLADEDDPAHVQAESWINGVAQTEAEKLVTLALEGVR